MGAARSAAKTLVDGVIGGTESLLAANAAASVEASDRVRTIVAALGVEWTAGGLREWIDAIAALEASSAEAAARRALEGSGFDEGGATGSAGPTGPTGTTGPGYVPTLTMPTLPPLVSPPPPPSSRPSPADMWPVIWNEYWRPSAECGGIMGLKKTFPANDFGNGLGHVGPLDARVGRGRRLHLLVRLVTTRRPLRRGSSRASMSRGAGESVGVAGYATASS